MKKNSDDMNTSKKETGIKEDLGLEKAPWADYYIVDYMENNKGLLSKANGQPINYSKDTTTRDGKKYVLVKIGYSFNQGNETIQQIFIDQLTKDVFEFACMMQSGRSHTTVRTILVYSSSSSLDRPLFILASHFYYF